MITITLILTLLSLKAFCPAEKIIYIEQSEVIQPCDVMLYAFQKVESNFNTTVVNWLGYTGILQIGQEMTDEANRICEVRGNPQRFTFPESALDSLESVQIWYIVQGFWNPTYDLKRAAKIWNPLASERYYNKIKNVMSFETIINP